MLFEQYTGGQKFVLNVMGFVMSEGDHFYISLKRGSFMKMSLGNPDIHRYEVVDNVS